MDINQAWKSTCRVIFGEEIGEIQEFSAYLKKYTDPISSRPSALSGKEAFLSEGDFCPGAAFIRYDENEEYSKKLASKFRLGINQLKDLDSILEALGENACYAGSIVLGNSAEVSESNRCTNANAVKASSDIYDSKYVAFSSMVRYGEHVFGCTSMGECKFMVRGFRCHRSSRMFESVHTEHSSGCFFCGNIDGCQDMMFSFNQRSGRHMIGNCQLSREEYSKLKVKLVEDIRTTLEAKRNVTSVIEIVGGNVKKKKDVRTFEPSPAPNDIEKRFKDCSRLLFGRELSGIGNYRAWLYRHVPELIKVKSAISERQVCVAPLLFHEPILESCVTMGEADEVGKLKLADEEVHALSVANAAKILEKIRLITPEIVIRQNARMVDCGVIAEAADCYFSSLCAYSKYAACSFWPRESEHVFGTDTVLSSKFCIKCYNSENLTRCFEVSDSNSCTDCYFCHNCENVHDSMFCFNAKNLRHAVGNVEMGKEAYLKLKRAVMGEIFAKLEKDRDLKMGIFNIGCRNEKK